MWWKIYFWFGIVLTVVSMVSFFAPEKQNIPVHVFLIITYCVALVGLYSFAFQKSLISQHFWKYYFWFYILLDVIYLTYGFLPTNYAHYVSFLAVYQDDSTQNTIINTVLDIPIIYAMYCLVWDQPLHTSSKKQNEKYKWGMIQIALWGYSIVVTCFFFLISLLPQSGSSNLSAQTFSSFDIIVTIIFLPIFIFWLWVVIQYKKYSWNWWRTTLVANALLLSGVTVFSIFDQQTGSGSSGFDIVGFLQVFILLLSLYIFGKDQFSLN